MTTNTFGYETDLSLDYYKELKHNINDKYSTVFSELNNRYNVSNTKELKTVQGMLKENKMTDHVLSLDEKESRLGRLRLAKENHINIMTKKPIKLKKSANILKSEIVIDQINSLFESLDNLKTRSDNHPRPVDSLLNSHKDFILMNVI